MSNNRIIIPCRIAYLNCWKPTTAFGTEKYSLVALIDKSDSATLSLLQQTIETVKQDSINKWGGRIPPNCRIPLNDGDINKPDNPIFKNCFYINAKCKHQPEIVDYNVNPIINQKELYSGCYSNISLTFYSYNCGGNKGVGVLLGNIQKIKDGPYLNGQVSAADEFKPLDLSQYA